MATSGAARTIWNVYVDLDGSSAEGVADALRAEGWRVVQTTPLLGGVSAELSAAEAAVVGGWDAVEAVVPDRDVALAAR